MSELQHHGILGQKWGVRRFRNRDGSLTSAGKIRYSSDQERFYNQVKNVAKEAKKNRGNSVDKIKEIIPKEVIERNQKSYNESRDKERGMIDFFLNNPDLDEDDLDDEFEYLIGSRDAKLWKEADRLVGTYGSEPLYWYSDFSKTRLSVSASSLVNQAINELLEDNYVKHTKR